MAHYLAVTATPRGGARAHRAREARKTALFAPTQGKSSMASQVNSKRKYIQKAGRIIDFMNLTEEERIMAKSLERAQADYDLEMYSSYVYGVEDGVAKGNTERQTKIARLMLGEGLQPEIVAKCTELPLASVMAMC